MRRFHVLVILLVFPLSAAAQSIDIIRIYDLFVASNAAAQKCSKPDEETKIKFLKNFTVISLRAAMAFKERNSSQPDPELIAAFKNRTNIVVSSVEEDIRANGCASQKATQLLKLYKVNSEFKLP